VLAYRRLIVGSFHSLFESTKSGFRSWTSRELLGMTSLGPVRRKSSSRLGRRSPRCQSRRKLESPSRTLRKKSIDSYADRLEQTSRCCCAGSSLQSSPDFTRGLHAESSQHMSEVDAPISTWSRSPPICRTQHGSRDLPNAE
jgi:hypothetical protein